MRTPISDLTNIRFDLIVIGAGINGTGITRDAALRGLSVLLVDKSDVASGTTSWSSRLIHGGLRYLEYAEIGLVRESLRERERLLHFAPHLVQPIPLTLPIYKHHKRGPMLIRAGMVSYDLLSFDKSLPRHRMYTAAQALAHEPGLNPEALTGAARYYDAQVEFPERLALENALDAIAHGATMRTYTEVTDFSIEAGVVRGVVLKDVFTGESTTAQGGVVVNVAGPWVDRVLASRGESLPKRRLIGATKGSHIVVEPFPGAPTDALYVEASQDGRPYFIIPWNDLYLIGTTDVRFDGDPDAVHPSEAEVEYLLTETNIAIPAAGLTREKVLYGYAGLRPLPYQPEGKESAITRQHVIHDHQPEFAGLLSIIGGKLTTFRSLSEQVVDQVYLKLGRISPESTTGTSLLPGAMTNPETAESFVSARPDWLSEQSAQRLVHLYGSRSRAIVERAGEDQDLRAVVHEPTGAIGSEIVFAVESESASTLHDIMLRRTMLGYSVDAGQSSFQGVGRILIKHAGWTAEQFSQDFASLGALLTANLALPFTS
ncbi:MAG: glycerol-3-phosphate dehydrogenase [Thermomicrobiales bacterium]